MISSDMLVRHLSLLITPPYMLRLYESVGNTEDQIVEVTGGGYTPKPVAFGDWTITNGSPAIAEGAVKEFRFDGSKRIRALGAYLTSLNGKIFWIQPFDEPLNVGRRGDIIPVRPVLRLGPIS